MLDAYHACGFQKGIMLIYYITGDKEVMNEELHIALCDDEKCIHDTMESILAEYEKEKDCDIKITHFFSAKELLESKEEIQILLLDIEMPQMDGIEAAIHLQENGSVCKIIMLTGRPERFKEAFKIGAYRFVTKPVDSNELKEAIEDTRKTLAGYEKVQVKYENTLCWIFQYSITYVEACGDYVKVYTRERQFESDRTLKSWKEQLNSRLFIECHKSYIINLDYVKCVKKNAILLENDREVPIARRRKNQVVQAFVEYDTK